MATSPSADPARRGVVVIGSFVQDLTWDCAEFPRPGQTVIGRFRTGPGGKGSNQAVAAARAGAAVTFVGGIGRDTFGAGAREFLRAEGIDFRAVEKAEPTGTASILVNAAGENEIVVALGASAALTPADFDAIAGRRIFSAPPRSSWCSTRRRWRSTPTRSARGARTGR